MLFSESYQQAVKAPIAPKGEGWAYARPASMQAAMAQALSLKWCLVGQAIYDWANRHRISLWDQRRRLESPDLLLIAVLNDWNLDRAEQELKG